LNLDPLGVIPVLARHSVCLREAQPAKACLAAAGKARLHLSHFDCGLLKGSYDAISLGRGTEEYFLYSYWKSV